MTKLLWLHCLTGRKRSTSCQNRHSSSINSKRSVETVVEIVPATVRSIDSMNILKQN